MGTRLVLKIKRRTLSQWLTLMLVMMPFAFGSLIHLLHVPSAVKYTLDVAWVILLVTMYCYQKALPIRKEKKLIAWTLLFFVCTLLAYLPLFQSGLYYLWGGRNLFRFYVAFFAFALLLSQEDVERTMKWFDRLFWVNFVVSLIQYYIYGYKWDYLGGIFGVEQGCNGYTNLFFSIVLTKSVVLYMEKKEKLWLSLAKFSAAMVVAALAELKFFFVEAILIVVLAALFTNFTWRKLLLIIGCLTAVVIGAALLTLVFPHLAGWFSLNWFWETATSDVGYTGSGDLNRLTAIPQINELWLTHWSQRIFGLGLGNCDTASYAVVNTPFFKEYGHLHYRWLAYAMMYLECGWVGLVFYFGFFMLVFFAIQKIERNSVGIAKSYCRISKIMAVMCAIISVYNSSLRTEAGYMAYFVLAIPFVFARCGYGKQKSVNQVRETSFV